MSPQQHNPKTADVRSSVQWIAVSDESWCRVQPQSGSGNMAVTIVLDSNTSTAERAAHVTFSAAGVSAQVVTITQAGMVVNSVHDAEAASSFELYPNPSESRIHVRMNTTGAEVYYITIADANGRAVLMLPQPELANGIDVSGLARGTYYVRLTDKKPKSHSVRVFQKQ
jgi:hypothetical protein